MIRIAAILAGNKRHRVVLPYTYLSRAEWRAAAAGLGLTEVSYDPVRGLYPWPLSVAFGRGLHFVGLWGSGGRATARNDK